MGTILWGGCEKVTFFIQGHFPLHSRPAEHGWACLPDRSTGEEGDEICKTCAARTGQGHLLNPRQSSPASQGPDSGHAGGETGEIIICVVGSLESVAVNRLF